MANKRMRKLIQNSQRRSRREESSNRGVDDGNESQYTTSHSPLEIQNEEVNEQVENEVMSSSQSQQRKRGKTIMRDIHALHPDHVLVVEFNERGQPYGDLQPTLANFIGTIARNGLVLPLHFLDWRKMPANRLNDAWKLVTARFYIPNHHRRVIMQMMGAAWRWWRTEVKATSYDSNTSLEELVAIQPIPHGLTPQTWEVLCNYWKSTESQENGRKPSRIEIQQLSRRSRKKGGAAIDDEAIRIENLFKEAVDRLLQDKPEGTQPLEVHEEAFREVFGPEHSGRVRCLGAGALPSQVFPEQCKRTSMYPSESVINRFYRYPSGSVINRFYRYPSGSVNNRFYKYTSGSVINRFYRYPTESALIHKPPVNFTASVGFSVANICNGFEPVQ
ncbi:hypothetical protein ZIOFF_026142 [Zingiber officinale]|uniref:Uncharacterized protein n=1 Tax=Zingiber officinale TaxID=94328 RepID=A0A8J5H3M2_ZINOF|nr:hypothetical protein ZIOFF_026142 [Zingiber officinale]